MTGQEARGDEREALVKVVMTAMGCDQHEDQGDCATCDSSIVSCSHPLFLYCDTHDEDAEVGEPCPAAVKVVDAVLAVRKHPEPEITDEMTAVAVKTFWTTLDPDDYELIPDEEDYPAMRAAIAAALRVPVGEGEQS